MNMSKICFNDIRKSLNEARKLGKSKFVSEESPLQNSMLTTEGDSKF